MAQRKQLHILLADSRANAYLAWILIACLALAGIESSLDGEFLWTAFVTAIGVVALLPAIVHRQLTVMLPWELLLFAVAPIVGQSLTIALIERVAIYIVIAAFGLILTVELDAFTSVEMTHWFAVPFVLIATLAIAGIWAVSQWLADIALGTQFIRNSNTVMWGFVFAAVAGGSSGILFELYFRQFAPSQVRVPQKKVVGEDETEETTDRSQEESSKPHNRFSLSERRQQQLIRLIQALLIVIGLLGIYSGSVSILVNSIVALGILQLPRILEHDYGLPIDTGLTLWITVPIFLHAVGTLGPYQSIGWWDQMTHALSASLVAAIGYTTVRAIDIHADDVYLPSKFMGVFLFLFIIAFGVLWEILEFGLDGLAGFTGTESVLSQYGLENIMLDLLFDTVGGLFVAVVGAVYLGKMSTAVAGRLGKHEEEQRDLR